MTITPAAVQASLKKLSGVAQIQQEQVSSANLLGNLKKLTSLISSNSGLSINLAGQLNPLTPTTYGQIKAITASITLNAGVLDRAVVIGELNALSTYIDVFFNLTGFNVSGQLKKMSAGVELYQSAAEPFITYGQLNFINAYITANDGLSFSVPIQLKKLSGLTVLMQQPVAAIIRPQSIYSRVLRVQNPYSSITGFGTVNFSEPEFTHVYVNGQDILLQDDLIANNLNDPSVNEIEASATSQSLLGSIQAGTVIMPGSILFDTVSNTTSTNVLFTVLPSINALPPGITFSTIGVNQATLSGTVGTISATTLNYQFLLRLTNALGIRIDRYFYFNVTPQQQILEWNSPPISDSDIVIGNRINAEFNVTNFLGRTLTFTISPALFSGLQIEGNAIVGTTNTIQAYGTYNFTVTVSDGVLPPISTNLMLNLIAGGDVVTLPGSSIQWTSITNNYLGSTYSLLPSYFGINATTSTGTSLSYSIAASSTALPTTLTLNSTNGNIQGLTPYITQNQTYSVTVTATAGSQTSDRQFTFKVLTQFANSSVLSASIYIEEPARLTTELNIWNTSYYEDSIIFRPLGDIYFGRILRPKIAIGSQSTTASDITLLQAQILAFMNQYSYINSTFYDVADQTTITLQNIGLSLRLGTIGYTAVYNPDGVYIYDVVYINVVDDNTNASGFVNGIATPVYQTTSSGAVQVYPCSLNNIRSSWLVFANPSDIPDAGLPLSQRGISGSGWQPVIEIIYVQVGEGVAVVEEMNSNGFATSILGLPFTAGSITIEVVN
jgi:hypothetical protein